MDIHYCIGWSLRTMKTAVDGYLNRTRMQIFRINNNYSPKWRWLVLVTGFINNSYQKDKALPVKTSNPNFVTFFVYFGNSLLNWLWNFFVCLRQQTRKAFCSQLTRVWLARFIFVVNRYRDRRVCVFLQDNFPRRFLWNRRLECISRHLQVLWIA